MKRFIVALLLFLAIPSMVYATDYDQKKYDEYLKSFDISAFEDKLDRQTKDILEDLSITDYSYDSITALSINDIVDVLKNLFIARTSTPMKTTVLIVAFIILSSLATSIKSQDSSFNDLFSTVTALIISTLVLVKIRDTLALSNTAMSVVANFSYAFFPIFCGIVIATGGATTAFSTNTLLLTLSQFISFIASNVFAPIINCFLALGICSSIRYELNLQKLLSTAKGIITKSISLASAIFVSFLSIKTAVASRADAIGLRSIRFAINTVVPVIGSSISEGLVSIQAYSSLIKSSVGVVGIISVALIFLPSILEVVAWRLCFSLCSIISEIFEANSVNTVIKAFNDTMLIINIILVLSMVTTIISIGILVASGGA